MNTAINTETTIQSMPRRSRRRGFTAVLIAGGLLASASMPGCNNAGEGAISGAFLGALGGLAIGSMSGAGGKGAAIGAIGGAIAGGAIGDQNERNARGHGR